MSATASASAAPMPPPVAGGSPAPAAGPLAPAGATAAMPYGEGRWRAIRAIVQTLEAQALELVGGMPEAAALLRTNADHVRSLAPDDPDALELALGFLRRARAEVAQASEAAVTAQRGRADARAELKRTQGVEATAARAGKREAQGQAKATAGVQAAKLRLATRAAADATQPPRRRTAAALEAVAAMVQAAAAERRAAGLAEPTPAEATLVELQAAADGLRERGDPAEIQSLLARAAAQYEQTRQSTREAAAQARTAATTTAAAAAADRAAGRQATREEQRVMALRQLGRIDRQLTLLQERLPDLGPEAAGVVRGRLDGLRGRADGLQERVARVSTDVAASVEAALDDPEAEPALTGEAQELFVDVAVLQAEVNDLITTTAQSEVGRTDELVALLLAPEPAPQAEPAPQPEEDEPDLVEAVERAASGPVGDGPTEDGRVGRLTGLLMRLIGLGGPPDVPQPAPPEPIPFPVERVAPAPPEPEPEPVAPPSEPEPLVASSVSTEDGQGDLLFDAGAQQVEGVIRRFGLVWKPIARVGRWAAGLGGDPLHITPEMMRDVKAAFDANVIEYVDVPDGHYKDRHGDHPLANQGYVRQVLFGSPSEPYWNGREGDHLWAGLRFTEPETERKVENGSVASVSGWFKRNFTDWRSGKKWPWVLWHVALTNKPIVTGVRSFAGASAVLSWEAARPGSAVVGALPDENPTRPEAPVAIQEERMEPNTQPIPAAPDEPLADGQQVILSAEDYEAMQATVQQFRSMRQDLHRANVRTLLAAFQGRAEHDRVQLPEGFGGFPPAVLDAVEPILAADFGEPRSLVLAAGDEEHDEDRASATEIVLRTLNAVAAAAPTMGVSERVVGAAPSTGDATLSVTSLDRVARRLPGGHARETPEEQAARVDRYLSQQGLAPVTSPHQSIRELAK
jgi:hypothetical protein